MSAKTPTGVPPDTIVAASQLLMRRLALALALAGCGSAPPAAPTAPAASTDAAAPRAAACDLAAARLIALQGDRMFGPLPADARATWSPRIEAVLAASCREDGWPDDAVACTTEAADGPAIDACGDRLGPEVEQKLTARLQPVLAELMAAVVPAAAGPIAASGIPPCDQYMAALERYLSCGKVTAESREALTANLATLRAAFARSPDAPVEKKQDAAATCARADAALRSSAAELGCPL
jgi:hypothetical protein